MASEALQAAAQVAQEDYSKLLSKIDYEAITNNTNTLNSNAILEGGNSPACCSCYWWSGYGNQ